MARIKGPKKTNRYPDEFKIKAIQLADHPDILANEGVKSPFDSYDFLTGIRYDFD